MISQPATGTEPVQQTVGFAILKKNDVEQLSSFKEAYALAEQLRQHLGEEGVRRQILEQHVPGAPSTVIQNLILDKLTEMEFVSQKRGLFAGGNTPGLTPDYYRRVGDTGILLEVERGKTIMNNMDLLDFWKCHICEQAEYLFLLVPLVRRGANGTTFPFQSVQRRLSAFFEPKNYVNVSAVFILAY